MRATPSRLIDPATGRPFRPPAGGPARPRARYDAARTTDDNRRHWANADGLSARAANSPDVRQKLRDRSRYERANNGYAGGLVLTLANDLVGTGPRPAVQGLPEAAGRALESAFGAWMKAARFAQKLHTAKQAKSGDGEAFLVLATNPAVADAVQLDVRPVECDQVATPPQAPGWGQANWVDGIEFDAHGNPAYYHVLRHHPGDTAWPGAAGFGEYDRVRAEYVLHWFRADRPGQARGVPELTAGLPLYAQLRRWTLATLTAAETAADFAAVLQTEGPTPGEDDGEDDDAFETVEIEKGVMVRLPRGAKLGQLEAHHPTSSYPDFKQELLKEAGRGVNAPYCVSAGDSSPYNYSSARMDRLSYESAVRVERSHCEPAVLDRVWRAWYAEAVRVPGHLPAGLPREAPAVNWHWPGFGAIDPVKEAQADTEALANGTTTLRELYAGQGKDWEEAVRQRGREVALLRELGLPVPGETAAAPAPGPADAAGGDGGPEGEGPEDDGADHGGRLARARMLGLLRDGGAAHA